MIDPIDKVYQAFINGNGEVVNEKNIQCELEGFILKVATDKAFRTIKNENELDLANAEEHLTPAFILNEVFALKHSLNSNQAQFILQKLQNFLVSL